MRFIVKVSMPVEAGNQQAKQGFKALPEILEQIKPEAAYFYEEHGRRTGLLIVNMNDASEIPGIAEPFFIALNAAVEFHPVMTPEDLQKAGPAIAKAVEKYG
jgi:hypothetical protein